MTSTTDTIFGPGNPPPQAWHEGLLKQLGEGEQVLDWFEPDLDSRLRFAKGIVVLTNRRLITVDPLPQRRRDVAAAAQWHGWPLDAGSLQNREQAGVGTMEFLGPNERLAVWRYTAGNSAAARRLLEGYILARSEGPAAAKDLLGTVCPSCGDVLPPGTTKCPTCSPAAAPPPSRSLFRLWRFGRRRLGMLVLAGLLTLLSTVGSLLPPYLTKPLMDEVLIPIQNGTGKDFSMARWYLLGLLGAAVFTWLLGWARTYVMACVSERIASDIRNSTYGHLQALSLEFFGGKRTGDLISRVGSDTDRLCNFLSVHVLDFATDIMMILLTSTVLLWIDFWLAIFTLAPFPIVALLVRHFRGKMRHGFARATNAWGAMISVLTDAIPGIRVVKAFAQEQREIDRFQAANDHVVDSNDRVNVLWSFFEPTVAFLTSVGLIVIWAVGSYRVLQGEITVGVLTAFVAYISRFYTRLDSMSRMIATTQRAAAAAHRVFEILDRKSSVPEPVRPVRPERLKGSIEMRNVVFKYGTRTVVRGVSLDVRPGEMIGLVGPSGAGKSTLVNLVCRFFDVADGAILVDGVDIRSFPVSDYRRNIGLVLQDPFLFFGTIAENIAYGRPTATSEEIIAAAKAARAHDFILKLPDGYDSLVGERGQSLSGGERQRISIARALLTDPRILILDEATSSVDTETERDIQLALETLIQGRTTIAIAHRLSTLSKADRLVVLEDGRISEIGRHAELLEKSGTYSRLHRAQLEMAQHGASV